MGKSAEREFGGWEGNPQNQDPEGMLRTGRAGSLGQEAVEAWLGRKDTEKVYVKLAFWAVWRRTRRLRLNNWAFLSKKNEEIM